MANFALEQVVTMECMRMDFIEGSLSDEEAVDVGILGYDGTRNTGEYAEKNATVPWDHENELTKALLDFNEAFSTQATITVENTPNRAMIELCKKHSQKWTMLKGMAIRVNSRRFLSSGQCAWLEMNYCGGSLKFKKDMIEPVNFRKVIGLANIIMKFSGK